MELDLFSILGFVLTSWVLISPGWRVFGLLKRRSGPLGEPLVERAPLEGSHVNYLLPSWCALSVAQSVFWCWFFSAGSGRVEYAKTLLWSDPSTSRMILLVSGGFCNAVWLFILCFFDLKKTLLSLAATVLLCLGHGGVAFWLGGSDRMHLIGIFSLGLTVTSNLCRVMSSSQGQARFSTFALSVAMAGALSGTLWIPKACIFELLNADFLNVCLVENFYWKASVTAASTFRVVDAVWLIRLAGGIRNAGQEIKHSCSLAWEKLLGSAPVPQRTPDPEYRLIQEEVPEFTDRVGRQDEALRLENESQRHEEFQIDSSELQALQVQTVRDQAVYPESVQTRASATTLGSAESTVVVEMGHQSTTSASAPSQSTTLPAVAGPVVPLAAARSPSPDGPDLAAITTEFDTDKLQESQDPPAK